MNGDRQMEQIPSSDPSTPRKPSEHPRRGWVSSLLLTAVSVVVAMWFSHDWCCSAIPLALLVFIVDRVLRRLGRQMWVRGAVCVVLGLAIGWLLRVDGTWAFEEALEMVPPAGVSDVHASRHFMGGPGEHALIVEFHADADALAALKSRAVDGGDDSLRRWQESGGDWMAAFDVAVGRGPNVIARRRWSRISPLQGVQGFDLGEHRGGRTLLFVEPATGRCVLVHRRL